MLLSAARLETPHTACAALSRLRLLQYKSGAKCGDLDGNATTSDNFTACPSATMLFGASVDAVAINGRTDAGAIPYCCEVRMRCSCMHEASLAS
jgi:hypothetical protein